MPGPTFATFGDLTLSRGFDFTFGPGVQPSVCTLYTIPHGRNWRAVGTLKFETAGEQPFVFPQCLVSEPILARNLSGEYWTLPIKDRRWKWEFAYIHGSYNVRQPDDSLLREKTPQELATMLFSTMGETDVDVSAMPNDARPQVEWDGASAATELEQLCSDLSCVVVLNPLSDKAEVHRIGIGQRLPQGPTQGITQAPVFPAQPERVRVESGHTLFQGMFELEAVGLDTDGRWKLLDDLSYKPADGWGQVCVKAKGGGFPNITGTYLSNGMVLKTRDLAQATVFRCYRIKGLPEGGWEVRGSRDTEYEPAGFKDFKFYPTLVDEEIGPEGELRRLDAVVYAKYFRLWRIPLSRPERYTEGFSFDTETGIITFQEPVFHIDLTQGGDFVPATVYIECAFNCGKDGVFHRGQMDRPTGGAVTTPTRLIQRTEVIPTLVHRYKFNESGLAEWQSSEDNAQAVQASLQHWLNADLSQYGLQDGQTRTYKRLMRISPDGLTQQITWSGGGGREPTTVASQGQRHNRYIRSIDERRTRRVAAISKDQLTKLTISMAANRLLKGAL